MIKFSDRRATDANAKIFLTGATGVVGQALLDQLPAEDLICLVHDKPLANRSIETVRGDIRKPLLGLSRDEFDSLAGRIGRVIHGAASTCFTANARDLHQINVAGTQNLIDLAARAGAPMTHVSTAFVHPVETACDDGLENGFNAYEQSKRMAEDLIRLSDVATTIVRPSIVIGDSQTGEIAGFQGLHQVLSMILQNRLPILPASPGGRIDYIPQDTVARSIVALINADVREGDFWLTAGTAAPVLEALLTTAMRTYSAYTGMTVAPPKLTPPSLVRRARRLGAPRSVRSALKQLEAYRKYLAIHDTLPSSFDHPLLSHIAPENRHLKTAFIRGILHWADTRNINAAAASGTLSLGPSATTPKQGSNTRVPM